MTFSIKDFFSKCNQILSFLRIWSRLLKKSLIENFIFCAVILIFSTLQKIWQWDKTILESYSKRSIFNYTLFSLISAPVLIKFWNS